MKPLGRTGPPTSQTQQIDYNTTYSKDLFNPNKKRKHILKK